MAVEVFWKLCAAAALAVFALGVGSLRLHAQASAPSPSKSNVAVQAESTEPADAQQPLPKFEVVSIKARPRGSPPVVLPIGFTADQPGGRYVAPGTAVMLLIAFAYEVKQPLSRILGLPDWTTASYDISAKAGEDLPLLSPAENRRQVRLMVQQMLAERFHLKLHSEVRQETILKMSVDPGGLRLKEVAAPVPPSQEGRPGLAMSDSGGRFIGTKVTMAAIASSAGTLLRQDVYDETGLKGYYDFNIRWTAPSVPNAPPPSGRLGPDGMALFITTLKDEFGLRFSGESGQVQYWIVDHIEPPRED
jgi:uncharacterized protein (TIGR03435 family)